MTVEQARDEMEDPGVDPEEAEAIVEPVLVEAADEDSAPPEARAYPGADTEQLATTSDDRAALLAFVPEVEVSEPPAATEPVEEASEPAAAEPGATPVSTTLAAEDSDAIAFPDADTEVSIWPFVALDVIWLAFAGFIVWQLTQLPEGAAVYESGIYPLTLLGGLVLTAAGPVLIVVSWFAEKVRLAASSGHVFVSALMRGSLATLVGVALWWIALLAVDQIRLGRLF